MMSAGILKLWNGSMPVKQACKKTDLPSLAGGKIRSIPLPGLPYIVCDVRRCEFRVHKDRLSVVFILRSPLAPKQSQSDGPLENPPRSEERRVGKECRS